MLQLSKLSDNDLFSFVPLDLQKEEFATLVEYKDYMIESGGDFYCFKDSDIPVLILGVLPKINRIYDTITLFSKAWKPIYYKTVIPISKDYFNKLDCDRIEHMVRCDRPWADKMAKSFGFTYLATFRKYLNGVDCKMYEVVK